MDADHWGDDQVEDQHVPPGADPIDDAVTRLQQLLDGWAPAFARERFEAAEGVELRHGRRGLNADESASFLRGLDRSLLSVDDTGGVRAIGCRPKPGGGRYSLFTAARYGDDPYVALNLEYVIQLGAACELVAFRGWEGDDVAVEVGEFDAVACDGRRVVLAMEAKARVDGPDSLRGLWRSLVGYAAYPEPPAPTDNHSRKYVELLRLTESGPVVLWLVADGARWTALATRSGNAVAMTPFPTVDRTAVMQATSLASTVPARPFPAPAPNVDFAVEVARLTELDGQQRCYEHPWHHEDELRDWLVGARERLAEAGVQHARPWCWRAATSGGRAMSPSGKASGLELRFSYYAGDAKARE